MNKTNRITKPSQTAATVLIGVEGDLTAKVSELFEKFLGECDFIAKFAVQTVLQRPGQG